MFGTLFGTKETPSAVSEIKNPNNTVEERLQQEINSQLGSLSTGLDKAGVTIKTLCTNSEYLQYFFKNLVAGSKQGLALRQNSASKESLSPEESDVSVSKMIFNGLKEMSSSAFGVISGIALQTLLENAEKHNLDEEDSDLIKESQKELEEASRGLSSSYSGKTDIAKALALTNFIPRLQGFKLLPKEQEELVKINMELETAIPIGAIKAKDPAFLYRSARAMQRILNRLNAQPDFEDKGLSKELADLLNSVRSFYIVAQDIRRQLSKYHVIVGGFDVSLLLKWQEDRPEEDDIVSPISTLVDCQGRVSAFKETYKLKAPEENRPLSVQRPADLPKSQAIEPAEIENTNKQLSEYCEKLAAMSTMKAVDTCFRKKKDENFYRKILKDGQGKIRSEYAKTYSGLGKYLVHLPFLIVYKWINPLITKTFSKLVTDIRLFLSNDVDLLNFSEEKIKDLSDYMGRIELARENYLNPKTRIDEAGTFSKFCEQTIKIYEGKFSEEDLLKIFKSYIVDRYVARPDFSLKGFRIPLLTSFFEWVVWSIRKAIIRSYLKQSQLVETYLEDGTNSLQLAQLGFKKVLESKLKQLKDTMELNLARRVSPINTADMPPTPAKIEALREKLIPDTFHDAIEEFSGKLVEFIDIEGCNGDKQKLKRLDNKVDTLFQEVKEVIQPFLPLDSFSLDNTLKDACTTISESAILSFFSTKDSQVEDHLQNTLELLGRSFTYFEEEKDRRAAHQKYQEELKTVDSNLRSFLSQISQIAVKEAVNNKLENVSGERHTRVEQFIKDEQTLVTHWSQGLTSKKEAMQQVLESEEKGEKKFQALQTPLAQFVDALDLQLNHLSSVLYSKNLAECYTDVQRELYQTNQHILKKIKEEMLPNLGVVAAHNKAIYEKDQLDAICDDFINTVSSIDVGQDEKVLSNHIKNAKSWLSKFPEQDLSIHVSTLETAPGEIKALQDKLRVLEEFEAKQNEKDTSDKTIEQIRTIEAELHALSTDLKELAVVRINSRYPTQKKVDQARSQKKEAIFIKLSTLKDNFSEKKIIPSLFNVIKGFYSLIPDSLEKLTDQNITSLSTQLESGVFTTNSLATDLKNLKRQKQSEVSSHTKTLSFLQNKMGEKYSKDILQSQLDEKQKLFKKAKETIQQSLESVKTMNSKFRQATILEMKDALVKVGEGILFIQQESEKPRVKGYITVGQLQLRQTLSPKIVAGIVPHVQKKMDTVVKALGKSFHWKQLVLRFMAGIAKKQQSS